MRITLHQNNTHPIIIEANLEQTLAQALWLSGQLPPRPLCSGLGRCGHCKVRFMHKAPPVTIKEERILQPKEIQQHIRLACAHNMQDLYIFFGNHVELNVPSPPQVLPINNTTEQHSPKKNIQNLKLAVDLGTTSLCWRVLALYEDGTNLPLAEGKNLNPQMGAGADVISRLAMAITPEKRHILAQLVQKALQDICAQDFLPHIAHKQQHIDEICLAANTAMTAIFLEKDCTNLAKAPYALPLQGGETIQVAEFAPIYIPPQLAPFVGGDISAGYATLLERENIQYPFILADLGTNGEFILALNPEKNLIASVPMGPALEGIGLSFGDMLQSLANDTAEHDVVYNVSLGIQGLTPHTLHNKAPKKLCGTGYLSLIHCLLRTQCLDTFGHFLLPKPEKTRPLPLYTKIATHFNTLHGEHILYLWPHLLENASDDKPYLRAADVEEILKVKAAFSLALQKLLHTAKLEPAHIKHFFISGAMGSHVQSTDLEGLGFIPEGLAARLEILGNTALEGASLLLTKPALRQSLHSFAKQCTQVELTQDANFTENFMQHMKFSYIY